MRGGTIRDIYHGLTAPFGWLVAREDWLLAGDHYALVSVRSLL